MTPPVLPREARHGNRIMRFQGAVLGAASSQRPGVPRWSELIVYRLPAGGYVVSKIGRSIVAHRPECRRVTRHMPSWSDAGEEAKVRRVPCMDCQPAIGDAMDPHTRLEPTRYAVLQPRDPQSLLDALTSRGKPGALPQVVAQVLDQVQRNDPEFAAANLTR